MANVKKEVKANISIHNHFDIEVRDAVTGEIKQRAQAFNVVCDRLYSILCTYSRELSYGSSILYGSGTGTPARTDTALFHYEGYVLRNLVSAQNDTDNKVAIVRCSSVLGTTDAVGITITELGLSDLGYYHYDRRTITTHAMLQDMNGNPISITKTDTDVITIYSTVYIHYTGAGSRFVSTRIYSKTHGSTTGASFFAHLSGLLLGYSVYYYPFYVDHGIIEASNVDTRVKIDEWSNAGHFWTFNGSSISVSKRIEVNKGNISGIEKFIIISRLSSLYASEVETEFEIDSPGNYTIQGESVGTGDGTTTDFATKFSMPYNATVYVDGVQAQAQVKKETCRNNSNIIFSTPPANGAVITIDYTTDYIPKDSDHIIDFTFTMTFGDYQGA